MEIMSGQSDSSKKCVLTRRTVEKWIKENDKDSIASDFKEDLKQRMDNANFVFFNDR